MARLRPALSGTRTAEWCISRSLTAGALAWRLLQAGGMRRYLSLLLALAATHCSPDGGESCFTRGTLIHTPTGTVPIEDLLVGDEVLAFREHDLAAVPRRVTAVHRARVSMLRLVHVAGRVIETTSEHPFWDAERRRFVPARVLSRGDVLAMLEADAIVPAVISDVIDVLRAETEVFNLTVDGEHTYFAGSIAVHNKSRACRPETCPTPRPVPSSDAHMPAFRDGIELHNDTTSPVTFTARLPFQLFIDRDALTESIAPVIDPTHFSEMEAPARSLEPGRSTDISSTVRLSEKASTGAEFPASFVSLVDRDATRWFLVTGSGAAAIRLEGDHLTVVGLAPEVKVLPLFGPRAPECAPETVRGTLSWTDPPAKPQTIVAQTWDTSQACVSVEFDSAAPLRVCLPKEAWPFAVGERVDFGDAPFSKENELFIQTTTTGTLRLLRAQLHSRDGRWFIESDEVRIAERLDCASAGPCGTVKTAIDVTLLDREGRPANAPLERNVPYSSSSGWTTRLVGAWGAPASDAMCEERSGGRVGLELILQRPPK